MFFPASISVVLPAYNEAQNLPKVVTDIDGYLKTRFADYEILVVSEGSTDTTREVMGRILERYPRVKSFFKKEWRGFGGALRTGFREARKELIFYTDADRQFDIRELDLLLPLIEHCDIVSGYKIERKDAPVRRWMSAVYNGAMRVLFGVRVKDINCAFKLYRRAVFAEMMFLPNVTEGIINAEIFIHAEQKGFTIMQVPVHHYPRQVGSPISELGLFGGLTLVDPRVVWRFFKDTFRIARKVYFS